MRIISMDLGDWGDRTLLAVAVMALMATLWAPGGLFPVGDRVETVLLEVSQVLEEESKPAQVSMGEAFASRIPLPAREVGEARDGSTVEPEPAVRSREAAADERELSREDLGVTAEGGAAIAQVVEISNSELTPARVQSLVDRVARGEIPWPGLWTSLTAESATEMIRVHGGELVATGTRTRQLFEIVGGFDARRLRAIEATGRQVIVPVMEVDEGFLSHVRERIYLTQEDELVIGWRLPAEAKARLIGVVALAMQRSGLDPATVQAVEVRWDAAGATPVRLVLNDGQDLPVAMQH